MLPSTFDIMWPMQQQSLILLHPTVKEKMHLQENTLFDLDLVTWNVAQYPLHNVTYSDAQTDRRTTDRLWYKINIPFFLKKNASIMTQFVMLVLIISVCSHSSDEPAELCILTSLWCSHTQSFFWLIWFFTPGSLHPSQHFSVMLGRIFLGLTGTRVSQK